ncbi:hypothetical protein [Actinoplanes sp. NPDC089786]|uniref:hypothetical protein n=1 Tax=Actinoplanes sp. NPDC089786 TaxID=3155185 RepID=UPI0034273197
MTNDRPAFPGPWLGGISLILGPALMLTGALLRWGVPFFFPHQLVAYESRPGVMAAAYAVFLAGVIALWPGVSMVAARIGETRPGWAVWGGALVMTGLFARAFHGGVNTFAFALVDSAGTGAATRAVADYYAYPEWVVSSLSLSIMLGWVVLAIGGLLSHTLRPWQVAALALPSGLMIGVLKGTDWLTVVELAGLAIAFVPLGVAELRRAGSPARKTTAPLVVLVIAASVILGRLG